MPHAGWSTSGTSLASPFGGLPQQLAGRSARQLEPVLQGFGLGAGPRYDRFQQRLAGAQGPLADYIRQGEQFFPGVFGQAQQTGQEVSARGSAAYEQLQNQINQSLAALPQFQAGATQGLGYAEQYAKQAFDPTRDQPLYQEASRRLLDTIRPGLAARGLEGGGAGGRAESEATRDLAFNFAQQQRADQAQAIPQLQQAATTGAQLSQAGIPVAGQGLDAVSQLGQFLEASYGIPMQALQGVFGALTGAQQPAQNLAGITSPVALPHSKGMNLF